MDLKRIAAQRLRNEHLIGAPLGSLVEAVSWFGAVQAQDYGGSKWGLAQRMASSPTNAVLDRDFDDAVILRTHVLRPTWHFVTPADMRWLLALTGPRVQAKNAGRYRQLELDPATLRHGAGVIIDALEGGNSLTRAELADLLERSRILPDGQRMPYLLMYAELEALICSGPRKGKQHTYALLDERVPAARPIDLEAALAELTQRYFTSHGPATAHDFSWWSGLTVRDAREGVALNGDGLRTEEIGGRPYHFSPTTGSRPTRLRIPTAHLLPNYDEYLVAYQDYTPVFDADRLGHPDRAAPASQGHIVVLNGQAIGGWHRTLRTDRVEIDVDLLIDVSDIEWKAVQRAATGYARFMGRPRAELTKV